MTCAGDHQLRDGRAVTLRWAGPQDVPAIAQLFTDLSARSSRSRFHGAWCSPALAAKLASVSGKPGTQCVVASAPDSPAYLAAEARYVPMDEEVAEIGLTVADDYQGSGLGRLLLGALVERASEAGLVRLRALVSLGNGPMLHLLEPFGWVLAEPTDLSVACLEISTTGGRPGWPEHAAGRKVLVEQPGLYESARVAAMRSEGADIRHCAGPRRLTGRGCPLVTSGHCQLAEEADVILSLLPGDQEDCAAVAAEHRLRWPDRLMS